jgi:SAM-dependent methyltransferase
MIEEARIKKNKFGYYEVENKPSAEALASYYAEKYYQQDKGSYSSRYDEIERKYIFNKIRQKFFEASKFLKLGEDAGRLLELGSGEGFTLKFFLEKGWDVLGMDFSAYGCEVHNPECLEKMTIGDIFANLSQLMSGDNKWDLIWLDNILEHVLEPEKMLADVHSIMADNGVLVIEVPNDFSTIQSFLLENKYVSREYWVSIPDHLSYFNFEGLQNLCEANDYAVQSIIGDYPIELNLLKSATNYVESPEIGKSCHQARIITDNIMSDISLDLTLEYYRILAKMGMSRTLTAFLTSR